MIEDFGKYVASLKKDLGCAVQFDPIEVTYQQIKESIGLE